ncbi:uncharacterized protein [Gossypium hirsutum]|uniref:Reverse transcriptase Ty1/copia-type domain-containing protein n=1 Tax=Gossypium hirsutum TaxID=3635 RepID=A0ABM3BBX5_GOSHI|nr:uncharacterized protein LOC121224972 [Gossypium hirsutum]
MNSGSASSGTAVEKLVGPKSKASASLQLVHSDILGPTRTPSYTSLHYVMAIVDYFSRFNWRAWNSSSNDLSKNPLQQNGVAEHKLAHLTLVCLSWLHMKTLPRELWVAAFQVACHVESYENEPKLYNEAKRVPEWENAMIEEITALNKNGTWELVPKLFDADLITCKWVYRLKKKVDAASKGWKLWQLDVKNVFLYGELDRYIFMEQLQGFISKEYHDHACRLKKALYGLKQAPRAWFDADWTGDVNDRQSTTGFSFTTSFATIS